MEKKKSVPAITATETQRATLSNKLQIKNQEPGQVCDSSLESTLVAQAGEVVQVQGQLVYGVSSTSAKLHSETAS